MSKPIDLNEIKSLVDWVNLNEDVQEFSLKYGETELFISRRENTTPLFTTHTKPTVEPQTASIPSTPAKVPATPATAPTQSSEASIPTAPIEAADDEILIKAPMVGTFYAAPKPGAPAFVNEGDTVEPQTVLCIVEVMKLMNNLEAGVHGTVQKIYVTNEQTVEYGQPLMLIKLKQ